MTSYEVHLFSNTGSYLRTFTKRITGLTWGRHLGEVGRFSLTLSDRLRPVDPDLFQLNGRVAIYRKAHVFATAKLEMLGFIRYPDFQTDKRGVTRYTWYGVDQNDLLTSRIVYPYHPYNDTPGVGAWRNYMTSYADTMMRELVEDNLGAGSSNPTARDLVTSNGAGLTIAIESSATATSCTTAGQITTEMGGKNLLALCSELSAASKTFIAQGSTVAVPVYFDMCLDTDTSLTFRVRPTRWGMNHRADSGNPVYIGMPYGNLREPRREYDRTLEVNAGLGMYHAQSYSASAWALDSTRIGEAPLNRREAAASAGQDQCAAVGNILINEGKSKPQFSGMIQDTWGCRYGVHWGLGDELTVDYLGRQYNVMVVGLDVECKQGRERITPRMEVLE
jgi:hypothetical protein